jgi:proline iminopeptidase
MERRERLVDVGDTRLFVSEVGKDGYPIVVLHGGPGLDHRMWGGYLDPLADRGYRLILVDQRAQGRSLPCPTETWTLERMAADVPTLAGSLALEEYAVLGHSYGAFVALQAAADFPESASQTIVSSGLPSARFLAAIDRNLEAFEPLELREQVTRSWEKEKRAQTHAHVAEILREQWPFQFRDPFDPRIDEFERRTGGARYSADVLRHFANQDYGGIEVENRLNRITRPMLVLAGRHDRTCSVEGAEAIALGAPNAELVVFEESAHMAYVEENERYLDVVDDFVRRHW